MYRAPQELRTYFVTAVTKDRRRLFQVAANAELFVGTLLHYRAQGKFSLHKFVVMPDHIHVLWTPAPEVSLEKAVQLIKGGFSFRLKSRLDVWERGYFDRRIASREAYDACQTYIEQNPVRAGLVAEASAFPYSSAAGRDATDARPAWM